MIFLLRLGFFCNRIKKMATMRSCCSRRTQSRRRYLLVFVALCLTGLTLVAIFRAILRQQETSLVEYVVIGTDSHKSVLRLNRSKISIRRIELLSRTCVIDCVDPPIEIGARPIIGVFLVQEAIESPIAFDTFHKDDDDVKGLLKVHGSDGEEENDVKGLLEIQKAIHNDNDDNVGGFFGANQRLLAEKDERIVEPFIDCNSSSFDYAVYVVLRSSGAAIRATSSEEEGRLHAATPWIDRLLRRTTEECRSQRVNVTVWLTTISSSEVNLVNALNDVLIEAYFDNVTWYDLLIWSDDPAQRGHVPPPPLKWAEQPTEVLARRRNVGVVTSGDGRRLFVHRRHYEIFGNFFPLADWTLDTAVRYLIQLYSPLWSSHQRTGLVDQTSAGGGINGHGRVGGNADAVIGKIDGRDVSVGGNTSDGVGAKKVDDVALAAMVAVNSQLLQRYVKALDTPDFDQLRNNPHRRSGRVIAMSLYGDDPKYTLGAVRNAQLLPLIFPAWRLFIYCKRQAPSTTDGGGATTPSCDSVPLQVTRKLEELGAELKYIDPGQLAPMLWRFLPVDDATVDVFISRDSDSRLTDRDAAVVSAWLDTDTMFHCIRDHPSHAEYSISGGLWGARTKWLRLALGNRPIASRVQYSNSYLEDMRFLSSEIWPLVQSLAYCHDSVSCEKWPNSHPIAIERRHAEHVGQVFDAHSFPRQIDIDLLTAAERNPRCEPNIRVS